ncbi:MAG: hypothetical protein ABF449_11610 [Ethanoligenens sp.]
MSDKQDKRMIGDTGYEVRQDFRINGKEILLAENLKAEKNLFYLVCQYVETGFIGEYSSAVASDDYLETLRDFTGRINKEIDEIQNEREALNLPCDLFSAEDCYPHKYEDSIDEKVVAIKPEVFAPEYRRGDYQLVLVNGGSGAIGNPHGHAVYCYHLNSGKHTRFERYDVLGIVKELPDWAKESLANLRGEQDKATTEKQFAGNYEIIDRIEAGLKVFALGHNPNAPQPYGTWQGYKDSRRGFDMGHYFSTYEEAAADLHDRAAQEQKRLDSRKRNDEAR